MHPLRNIQPNTAIKCPPMQHALQTKDFGIKGSVTLET